jgi:hypothetical protein
MRRLLAALALLISAATAHAQYMPPARDIADVARLTTEYMRLVIPALTDARRYAECAELIVSVHQSLYDEPTPLRAIDKAIDKIEMFMRRHERDDPPLPKDGVRFIRLVKTWLEDTKMGPPPSEATVLQLRERVHHEVIHVMQRALLRDASQMQAIASQIRALGMQFDARVTSSLGTATSATPEATRP